MRRLAGLLLALLATWSVAAGTAEPEGWSVARLDREVPPDAVRDVTAGKLDAAFEAAQANRIERRGRSVWLRVKLERAREGGEPTVLVIRHLRTARATLVPPSGKPVTQSLYGQDPHPRFTRDALYFPLGTSLAAGETYYIHLEKLAGSTIDVDLRDMAQVNAANLAHMRIIALTIGAMTALGVTLLVLSMWLPERALFYLGANCACAAFYSAFLYGEGYVWFSFAADGLTAFNALAVAGALGLAFDVLFWRELLDFGRYARRISAMLKGLAVFFFAEAALLFAAGGELYRVLVTLGNLGALALWALVVPAMVVASIRGGNVARLLLGAWAITTLVTVPRIVSYLRGEPETDLLYYGFPIALVFGLILKACALAERVRLQRAGRVFVAAESRDGEDDGYEAVIQRLRSACEHSAAAGPTTVIKVQVDDAKGIAAAHGEAVLRACVAKLRSRIRHALRDDDTLGSVGTAEFLVVMPGANAQAAATAAERIRRRVNESRVESDGISIALTASVGIASAQGVMEVDSLMAQADAAAATADNAGGNQVVELPA